MQDTRSEAAYHSTKLNFLILTCVSEDEYANSLMHDAGLTFRGPRHRLPMRHRKVHADKTLPFRPLVCGLLGIIHCPKHSSLSLLGRQMDKPKLKLGRSAARWRRTDT